MFQISNSKTQNSKLAFLAVLLVGVSLLLVLAYSLVANFRLSVGEFGDGPWIAGFNGDEPGAPRYRWTGGNRVQDGQTSALINFPVAPVPGFGNKIRLELGAATAKDSGQKTPPVVTILANGVEVGKAQTVAGAVKEFEFSIPANAVKGDSFQLELRSPVFSDGRTLGVKVQAVKLLSAPAFRLPPFEVWFWALVYSGAGALLVLRLRSWLRRRKESSGTETGQTHAPPHDLKNALFAAAGGLILLLPLLAVPYLVPSNVNLWYGPSNSTPYLAQVAAWVMALLAVITWLDVIGRWLWEFPARLEEGHLARDILLVASLLYAAYALGVIAQMDFIGHADYADNGVVARNFVRGNGLSVDYAAQFYTRYDKLPHPADTWPLLQPLMIAPFFAILGPTAFAAKLPNLIIMLALAWAIFRWGSRYFNRKTALAAALLALAEPAFFEAVAYPINDLGFTFFTFLTLMAVYRAARYRPLAGATEVQAEPATGKPHSFLKHFWRWLNYPTQKPWIWAGLWGGLSLWSKPSGGVVLVGAGLWLLWQKFWNREVKIEWRGLFLWGGLVLLIFSPYVARGMLIGGTSLYSTERYDVWLLEYTPWEHIYDLYYPTNRALPEPRLLLNYGFDLVLKVKYNQFRDEARDLLAGNYIAPLLWMVGIVGLAGLSRRRYGLLGLVAGSFALYLLFINLYWHYEIRYFMVWLPWFFLFGCYGLSWLYDKIRQNGEEHKSRRTGKLGVWLVLAVFAVLLLPNLPRVLDGSYTGKSAMVAVSDWFKANTPGDAVIMSRNVWELSFHADRKSVMFPNDITTLEQMRPVLQDYGVKYLQFDHTNLTGGSDPRPDDPVWQERRALWPLIEKKAVPGYRLVYDRDGFLVYEITGNS